jgi:hypothetical protein
MTLDVHPRFPADTSQMTRKLTDLFGATAKAVNRISDGKNDLVFEDDAGPVVKDSSGHYWRISVDTSGALVTTDLGTSRP